MVPYEHLVKQILETLDSPHALTVPADIADEYVAACHETNTRLQQCVEMIDSGSDYQALQLAEADPPVLDAASSLSFARRNDWVDFCANKSFPLPERIDSKLVATLNTVYAKGVSSDHPLYKDYRAAVTQRDDVAAARIISTIIKLNPNDANARAEQTRLQNKLYQEALSNVRSALRNSDPAKVTAALFRLEATAGPNDISSLPEFERASAIRTEFLKEQATAECQDLLAQLSAWQSQGQWQAVGRALARVQDLQEMHRFTLGEAYEAIYKSAHAYFDRERRRATEEQEFQSVLQRSLESSAVIEHFLASPKRSFRTLQDKLAALAQQMRALERFGKPISAQDSAIIRRASESLSAEVARLQKKRRMAIATSATALILALLTGAWMALNAYRVREYSRELAELKAQSKVISAEKVISEVETSYPRLLAREPLKGAVEDTKHWTLTERNKEHDVGDSLAALEAESKGSFSKTSLVALANQLGSVQKGIRAVAEDLRPSLIERFSQVQRSAEPRLVEARSLIQEDVTKDLGELESAFKRDLALDRPVRGLEVSLEKLDPKIHELSDKCHPTIESLKPAEALVSRADALSTKAGVIHSEIAKIQASKAKLHSANTLEEFRNTLGELKSSQLAQTPEVRAARQWLVSFPSEDEILTALFVPDDLSAWKNLEKTSAAMMPQDVLPGELSKIVSLREDANLKDIWQATLIDYEKRASKRTVFSQGEIAQPFEAFVGDRKRRTWIGSFYDPQTRSSVRFESKNYIVDVFPAGGKMYLELSDPHKTSESSALTKLELNYMTNDSGAKYEKPLLRVFDAFLRQKDVQPLFRGYVFQQLRDVILLRSNEWGLPFCPQARADLAAFDKILNGAQLIDTDWLSPGAHQSLSKPLDDFFKTTTERSYYAQASINRAVAVASRAAGLHYGGYVDADGKLALTAEAEAVQELWALQHNGSPLVLKRDERNQFIVAKDAGLLSPVFYLPTDRKRVIESVSTQFNVSATAPQIRDGLAPFCRL